MRRDIVEEAGVPVPRARSFSLKRGASHAKVFAASIGYPVVVKPMLGESTVEVMPDIRDEEQLEQAIEYLRKVPTSREDFTTASYAFTQLLTPRSSSSTRTRGTYRFMVEERVSGQYVRLLLAEGRLFSAVLLPHGPWRSNSAAAEVLHEIHPELREFAEEVWRSCPGLSVMSADVVVNNFTESTAVSRPVLVDTSERPWMHVQYLASPCCISELGDELFRSAAEAEGIDLALPGSAPEVNVSFTWEGLSQVGENVRQAAAAAARTGIKFHVSSEDPVSGVVSGEMVGDPSRIALFNELVLEGSVLHAPVMAVQTRSNPGPGGSSFSR
ncbi:hypothetical protein FEF26_00260 [Nesterenkonia salmonea]|uniref:ATP-grasp domain-containing protein n=1 Tax=Nesterenkonia salmonea TaxID=1804987 RepID=A0A5R9BMZ5_9MICC|nr:hypothetical protein [Nesterenkonia salmonea]TLQ01452.1 hypothetical protein FEF26_00260 [Nesterenkonia salmonea]